MTGARQGSQTQVAEKRLPPYDYGGGEKFRRKLGKLEGCGKREGGRTGGCLLPGQDWKPICPHYWGKRLFAGFFPFIQCFPGRCLGLTKPLEAFVHGDGHQPGAEFCVTGEIAKVAESVD